VLTKVTIRNFKRFGEVEIELGNPVVLFGPNNSGKTTALQALALWDIGLRRWTEKRADRQAPGKRPGVTINQAGQVGCVLYLEGSTDIAILRAFAGLLDHPAKHRLARPFVRYVENKPKRAREHFHGLREAKDDLVGFALFDRVSDPLQDAAGLVERSWRRREIENYLCSRPVLLAWARRAGSEGAELPLFSQQWVEAMEASIDEVEKAMTTLGKGSPWSADTKVSDDFLDPVFASFFKRLKLPNLLRKTDYHVLARHLRAEDLDPEISAVLDAFEAVAALAKPVTE